MLDVYNCAIVDFRLIEFRPSNICTLYIPVTYQHPEFGKIDAYLDPVLKILSATSPEAYCRLHRKHILETPEGVIEFDTIANKKRIISETDISHPVLHYQPKKIFDISDFHDFAITNGSEIFEEAYNSESVSELERIHHERDEQSIIDMRTQKHSIRRQLLP